MFFNHKVIFRASDGGTTHKETLQLLMNLGTSVAQFTVEDGTTIDLIGYYHITVIDAKILREKFNSCLLFPFVSLVLY